GVYRFSFEACSEGPHPSEATLVLPLAGATVDGLMLDEIARADAFVSIAVANYTARQLNSMEFGKRWFVNHGYGDHIGRPDNVGNQYVWYYGQIDDNTFMGGTATWCGIPVRYAKMSNFIVAYAATRLGVSSWRKWLAQSIGTSNNESASQSWNAGCDIAMGAVYSEIVPALVRSIWNPQDPKISYAWPNLAALDNLISPFLVRDMNYYFCTPCFLYDSPMPSP
ncbi:MAG: hypothetical protein IKO55_03215, partial [Kiritimatiellae bacterium]|nr:hypothetical protein [Kiritimatiellia bacterium]